METLWIGPALILAGLYNFHCKHNQEKSVLVDIDRCKRRLAKHPDDTGTAEELRFLEEVYKSVNGWHNLSVIEDKVRTRLNK